MMEQYETNTNKSFIYDLNGNSSVLILFTTAEPFDLDKLLITSLGERRKDTLSVVFLTVVYTVIFLTGVLGNLSTCLVIWKNPYMHTVTNYYLFNLAISDVLTLLLALPPELYSIWEAYPFRLGEPFCILRSFIMEMTSYSSVLTITGFTIERYIAICHPIKVQRCCKISRAVRCIIFMWTLSILSALPYPIHTRLFYYLTYPNSDTPIAESLVCNIPIQWLARMLTVFQISTILYFVFPMIVITVFYVMIGLKLRDSAISSNSCSPQYGKATATRARRAVLKMLVAVVVAFFVCWAPFHAQRLMTLYVKDWTSELIEVQSHLFYVSGVLYFFSSTVNPILYNMLSRKFRRAFKRTLCRCCININSLPTFYKLRAKFINDNEAQSAGGIAHPNPDIINYRNTYKLATFYRKDRTPSGSYANENEQPSTRDTLMNRSSKSSTSSSHAHSDGGLHYLCRHKRCLNRRQSLMKPRGNCNNASYQDIDVLRKLNIDKRRDALIDYDFDDQQYLNEESLTVSEHPVLKITLKL